MIEPVLKEEWEAWLTHPATRLLREWARKRIEEFRDKWESGGNIVSKNDGSADFFSSAVQDAAAVASCSIFREIEALDQQKIEGEVFDEPVSNSPSA